MKLSIREATIDDTRNVYDWRTDPKNSGNSWTGGDFLYDSHEKWFKAYLEERDNMMLIVGFNDKPCSVVRFDGDFEDKTVSIYMVPSFHGYGLGIQCLLLAERYLKKRVMGSLVNLHAEIMNDNLPSVKMFTRAGYIYSTADWYKLI